MVRILVPVALAALTGCATQADHDQLVKRVSELEAKVAELDAKGASKSASARPKASAEDEGKAMELLKELETLIAAGKMTDAKAKVDEIFDKYPSTTAAARAKRTKAELSVVGKSVGAPDIESWFVEGTVDLASGSTLVVFWEIWCPHCRREVPRLQALHTDLGAKGLEVVGLTRLSRGGTEEQLGAERLDEPAAAWQPRNREIEQQKRQHPHQQIAEQETGAEQQKAPCPEQVGHKQAAEGRVESFAPVVGRPLHGLVPSLVGGQVGR